MNRNGHREEKSFCYFHPRQVVVGVCPLCLNERLLIVAAKQGHHHHQNHRTNFASKASSHSRLQSSIHRKPSTSSIHKIFAFGSLFSRPESQQWKSEMINYEYDASPSPEDSFISIKFEENGVASWEKSTVSKVSLENCNNMSWNHHTLIQNKDTTTNNNNTTTTKETNKSVIEHGKSRDTLRWRKRIGHMFQLIRWKRTGGVCHVGSKVEGVKVRKGGWMRTLTKRKKTVE